MKSRLRYEAILSMDQIRDFIHDFDLDQIRYTVQITMKYFCKFHKRSGRVYESGWRVIISVNNLDESRRLRECFKSGALMQRGWWRKFTELTK